LQDHELVELAVQRLALCNPDLGGGVLPSNLLLIKPRHLRSDDSRPSDMYAIAGGHRAEDAAMDLMITSSFSKPTLLNSNKSFDYALRLVENTKFKNFVEK
jgi:hypothetical protein